MRRRATRDDRENFSRLAGLLTEGNAWAEKSAALIVILAKIKFTHNGKKNYNYMYDSGAAAENLFLEAVSQELAAHEMIGFDRQRAKTDLAVPDDFQVAAMMAVGYPATPKDLDKLEPDLKARELAGRQRLPLDKLIYKGKFPNL